MKTSLTLFLLALFISPICAQEIPEGYTLVYQQDFETKNALSDFEMTDSKAWLLSKGTKGKSLEINKASDYTPRVRSPFNIAMLKTKTLGSFILEVELQQTGKEYGHRDLCLFFGMKDAENFYYTHIASTPDPHAHNIFLVNDEPRVAIGEWINDGINWGKTDDWHTVRVIRDIQKGTIEVYFDDLKKPIMKATDNHFDYGHVGFGTFDDIGKFDNIKIWAPGEAILKKSFFNPSH
ncbi:hypothetical protein IFO69_16225 [Echinicola sp. CAU 1574]|uniref:Lectin n=1 Tax=Echinicola arenosa TaxID=2774144 RepID=A0ABR9ANK5_9BACT|nr:hypothetical protein [Echinicola arenosa]MBD8490300.1 hypothetical protein [Echinicola arenosa]